MITTNPFVAPDDDKLREELDELVKSIEAEEIAQIETQFLNNLSI